MELPPKLWLPLRWEPIDEELERTVVRVELG